MARINHGPLGAAPRVGLSSGAPGIDCEKGPETPLVRPDLPHPALYLQQLGEEPTARIPVDMQPVDLAEFSGFREELERVSGPEADGPPGAEDAATWQAAIGPS